MDKLHTFLAVLKKQYFWVLCLVILIASTVVWMMAVDNIETQAEQNEQRIKSSLDTAKQVANISQHPNDQITAAYNQQTVQLRREVFQVWNDLFMKQRETVLKWPPALGEDFIKHVDSTPFMGPIPVDFRDLYFNYVKARWAELPPIIKAKPVAQASTGSSPKVTPTRRGTPDYVVEWEDQEKIRKSLFSAERPTVEWVWTTQEDLWIYENLLNVIKKTNTGALGPHNAVISTIISMDVGKAAARYASGKAGGEGSDSTASSASSEGLLNGRYVDASGIPVSDGTQAGKDEYKRIPVRLVLKMDAREVPLLILNCANAALPVEIQQVKVNVDKDSTASGKTTVVKSPDLSAEDRAAGRKTPHVEVSLQGLIYIFNPPNREKLHMPAEDTSVGTAAEAFSTGGESGTTTPTFDDEPAPDGAPMATVPGTETAPSEGAPAATGTAPETPAATDPTVTDPTAIDPTATDPAATPAAPTVDPSKPASAEDLFPDDEPAAAPAQP